MAEGSAQRAGVARWQSAYLRILRGTETAITTLTGTKSRPVKEMNPAARIAIMDIKETSIERIKHDRCHVRSCFPQRTLPTASRLSLYATVSR
jgi:hypothetical protein